MPRSPFPAVAMLVLATIAACAPDPVAPPHLEVDGIVTERAPGVIEVSSIADLYQSVNDPANAGRIIEIDSGTYMLDPLQQFGGRLQLQQDMVLRGATGRPEDVVIDASALTTQNFMDASQLVNGMPILTGAIRVGRGTNGLDALTIRAAAAGASGIATDLPSASAIVRIRRVVATGNQRGIDARNVGVAMAGRTLTIYVRDSRLVDNLVGQGQGIRILNTQGAHGASVQATMSGNEFVHNKIGCIAANLSSDGASVTVQSDGDLFSTNGNGCVLLAGNSTGTDFARDNRLVFGATVSRFEDNGGPGAPVVAAPNGITAVGAVSQAAGLASGNTLKLDLDGTVFVGSVPVDVAAFGAQTAAAAPAGTNNKVVIRLRGASTSASIDSVASVPVEPAGTNTVTIIR